MWDAIHGVGLRSAYLACCDAAPVLMRTAETKGRPPPLIVLVSSFGGRQVCGTLGDRGCGGRGFGERDFGERGFGGAGLWGPGPWRLGLWRPELWRPEL